MRKLKSLRKPYIAGVIVAVLLVPMLLAGCSFKSGSEATPTPSSQSPLQQLQTNVSTLQTSLTALVNRVSTVETSVAGVTALTTRVSTLENTVSGFSTTAIATNITALQGQVATLQTCVQNLSTQYGQLLVQIVQLQAQIGTGTPTPTPTPSGGATPTPAPGLVVTLTPPTGAVMSAGAYVYIAKVKNNYPTAQTFQLVADMLANTNSASVNKSLTSMVCYEITTPSFTGSYYPDNGVNCNLIRFINPTNLTIPAGQEATYNLHFTLSYDSVATTVWTCMVSTQ